MSQEFLALDSEVLTGLLNEARKLVGDEGLTAYVERALRNEIRYGPDRHAFPRDFVLALDQDPDDLLGEWLRVIRELVDEEGLIAYVERAIHKELNWGNGMLGELMDEHELAVGPPSDELVAEAEEYMRELKPSWLHG